MNYFLGLLIGAIPVGLTLVVSLLGFVRLRKLPNPLAILLSLLAGLVIWFIWLLVLVGVDRGGSGSVTSLAFGIGTLLELITLITLFILVRAKRCPACKHMAGSVSGEPEVLDTVHDVEVIRRPNGGSDERLVTRFLLEVPYACGDCGHEWTREKSVKRAGHVQ